jgi:hypothetical protein
VAGNHEAIKWQVISDWTTSGRGRLYCMNQGMATPVHGDNPIWFGPLKQKFKGFPDLFGFELIEEEIRPIGYVVDRRTYPIFTVIEVKTANDRIKPKQRDFMNWAVSQGIRAYVAWEVASPDGKVCYELKQWGAT